MTFIDWPLNQKAVYWPPESSESAGDDFDNYGQPQVSLVPVLISCRWADIREQYIDAQGTVKLSRSVVLVDRDVVVGGILMLGELADITDAVNIKENSNAWEIKRFDKIPDIDAEEFLGKAFL